MGGDLDGTGQAQRDAQRVGARRRREPGLGGPAGVLLSLKVVIGGRVVPAGGESGEVPVPGTGPVPAPAGQAVAASCSRLCSRPSSRGDLPVLATRAVAKRRLTATSLASSLSRRTG